MDWGLRQEEDSQRATARKRPRGLWQLLIARRLLAAKAVAWEPAGLEGGRLFLRVGHVSAE